MKITKLDPFTLQQQKIKNRNSSTSHDKAVGLISKKKHLQSINLQQPTAERFTNSQVQHQKQNNQYQQLRQQSPLTHSRKALVNELLFKDQKQTFLDFLQAQMRIENKEQTKPMNSKMKVKLPLISNNKQLINSINQSAEDQNNDIHKNIVTRNLNSTSNENYEKNQTKQSEFSKLNKENPIFINIKAVIPIEKTVSKKKDHSLRDLRILRKQKQENDFILESEQNNNQDSRAKTNTVVIKKNRIQSKQHSPLKLTTADKKNSRRNSIEKLTSALNRDKKSFSITQNKKKFSVNYADFCQFISSLNKIRISPAPIALYKAFVGKGNNSILVKNAIKNRFWWNIMTERVDEDVNFLWLQSRDNNFINQLVGSNVHEKKGVNDKQTKKQKYHLQNKNQDKTNESIKQFVHQGFLKLVSQKQAKQNNFTPFYAQAPNLELSSESIDPSKIRIHNHLQSNWNLTNKKALFYNLKTYYQLIKEDPFRYIPLTFHIKKIGDESWNQFKAIFEERLGEVSSMREVGKKKKKDKKEKGTLPLWIIKPGENSNQGCGIQVSDSIQEIIDIVRSKTEGEKNRSSIVQRYLMPFLYNKRKFDIRCYMVTTSVRGVLKGYWYQEGYIRTSCKQFTTKNLKNRLIHLTNDAVQKKSQEYGKYQNGNKISFSDFQKYLDNNFSDKKLNFFKSVYPQMMRLARDALTATYQVLDSKNREFTFEVFGLDFMIDEQFNTWLIQVNNNPCLELSSPLLARIIPNMIENAFKVAIDPLFPPPLSIPKTKTLPSDIFQSNKFTLIFNSGDIEQGFQHCISEHKVNLDQIVQGQEEDDELNDSEEQQCCLREVKQKRQSKHKKEQTEIVKCEIHIENEGGQYILQNSKTSGLKQENQNQNSKQ